MPIFTLIMLGIATTIQAFTLGMLVSNYISVRNKNKNGDNE
jgi:hypothetical protein